MLDQPFDLIQRFIENHNRFYQRYFHKKHPQKVVASEKF
jgi:hypothetical protein